MLLREIIRALYSALLTKYHWGDQVEKTETDRTCSTYEEEERFIQVFSGETLGKEITWKKQA
jgi:hypothetical protein